MSAPKRLGALRNTSDDEMTFAELLGVPDLDDAAAVALFTGGHSTAKAAATYRAQQIAEIERGKANKRRGQRAETLRAEKAEAFAWAAYDAQTGRKNKDVAATAAHKEFPKVPWQTIRNRLKKPR